MPRKIALFVAAAAILLLTTVHAQGPTNFAGKWVPVDAAKADALFDVGLTDLPGSGMTITQDAKTVTVASTSPAGPVKKVFFLDGSESPNTWGLGVTHVSKAAWMGAKLVVTTKGPSLEWTNSYSLEGEQLRIEMAGAKNTTVLLYKKAG